MQWVGVLGIVMRIVVLALLCATGLAGQGATAQSRAEVERCRAIDDDARRLDCYDAIVIVPATRSKYDAVPLPELMEFALTYRGDLVETAGWIEPGDDVFMLRVEATDEASLPVDVEMLSRHDRETFLGQCGEGCEATVRGRVRPVNFTTGIVAEQLIVR